MTTVSICINNNNLNSLTPFICGGVGQILDCSEQSKFWQVTAMSGNIKNQFIFDKRDFHSFGEVLGTIVGIVKK